MIDDDPGTHPSSPNYEHEYLFEESEFYCPVCGCWTIKDDLCENCREDEINKEITLNMIEESKRKNPLHR